MTLAGGVTTLAAAIGTLALICRGLSRLKQWLANDTRIRASLNRMDALFDDADRLERAGVTNWAAELRRDAWRVLLGRLARFEVNRESNQPIWVGTIVVLLYVAGYTSLAMGVALDARLLTVGLVLLVLATLGTVGWLWSMHHHERRIVARTDSLFAEHAVSRTAEAVRQGPACFRAQ